MKSSSSESKRELSRRRFLQESGLAAGAGAIAGSTFLAACRKGGAGPTATSATAAATDNSATLALIGPGGRPLIEPAVRSASSGLLTTNLHIAESGVQIGDA